MIDNSTGFGRTNEQELSQVNVARVKEAGGKVFMRPMIGHNINSAIGEKEEYPSGDRIEDPLRLFGQGTKVALECCSWWLTPSLESPARACY